MGDGPFFWCLHMPAIRGFLAGPLSLESSRHCLFNRIWACQPTALSHGHWRVTVPHRSVRKNKKEWKELFRCF